MIGIKADEKLGPKQRVTRVFNSVKRKLGKATGPFEVNTEMIVASGKIGVDVMVKLCQRVVMEE